MAYQIVELTTVQTNFVLIPEKPLDFYTLGTDAIKAKIEDSYEDSKPVVTQFPDFILIFEPTHQIGINIIREQNRIIISDSKITPYSERELKSFTKLVKESTSAFLGKENRIKQYGFNVLTVFELAGEIVKSGEIIKDEFLNTVKLKSLLPDIESAAFKVVFKKEGIRNELSIEPRIDNELNQTKAFHSNLNVHFNSDIPKYSEFASSCTKIYGEFKDTLVKLFI